MLCQRLFILLLALSALFILPVAVSAEGPPTPPCRFYGTVQLDGAPVPDGTMVTATVAGDTYTTTTPAVKYGSSTYVLMLVPLPGMSYDEGAQITFTIEGYTADQTGSWEVGGNARLDITASIPPPPTPTPAPTATPAPTFTPAATPTPIPTAAPVTTATPTPASTEAATNAWNIVIIALCVCILIICFMFAAYLFWKYRARPAEPRGKKPEGEKPEGEKAGEKPDAEKTEEVKAEGDVSMRWQDRLMLKMMSNKLVIKIFSIPIVIKVLTWETKVFVAIISLFRGKKAEEKETPAVETAVKETEGAEPEEEKPVDDKADEEKTSGGETGA